MSEKLGAYYVRVLFVQDLCLNVVLDVLFCLLFLLYAWPGGGESCLKDMCLQVSKNKT